MSGKAGNDVLGQGLRVLGHAIRTEPRLFTISAIGSSLFGLLIIANSYVVGFVIGEIVVPAFADGRVRTGSLALAVAALMGISGLRVVSIFGRRLGAGYMQFHLQARYRRAVTRRYLALPPSWHQKHATGSLLSNASSDVEAAFAPIAPMPFAVGTIVMILAAVVSLFFTDWVLAMVGVALFPALFGLNLAYSRRMSPRQIRAQRMRAKVSAVAHESFDGALVVKTMGREADESRRFGVFVTELRDALVAVGRLRGVFDPLMDSLPSVGTLAVLLLGTWRLEQGAISVTELVSVAFLFTVLAFPVRAIGWVVGELPRSVAGWERVQAVLSAEGDLPYGVSVLPGDGPAELRFEEVSYRYADGPSSDPATTPERTEGRPAVLTDVTFTVPAGKTVALVGATGSGKSTIASLAVRLVDPESGSVTLDGVKLPDLAGAALAEATAVVPQVPFVFDDTVRGNIALDRPDAGDDRVWEALRLAQADRFVEGLPAKLDTEVGERGTSLSGGQRQRLTLARAMAGRPRLLVLDDATSAVDPRVEAAILGALREAGTSILVVAYRRATIALADVVVYLHQGRVVATGTHAHLMATQPGYLNLVTAYEKDQR